MDCKITSIDPRGDTAKGFTVVEMVVASGAALLLATVLVTLSMFAARSFAAATNYTDMSLASRMTLDDMSRAIRQCRQVNYVSTNLIGLTDNHGGYLWFWWIPDQRVLYKLATGNPTKTYLTDCQLLQFWVYQRMPKPGTFDCYTPANVTNTKLVQVTWKCSRKVLGAELNTEAMETAKIVLRNH